MIFNHPILFAAAAVVAIGIAIYEILSVQNERTGHRRGGGRGPPSPPKDDPPGPSSSSKKSPKHPSVDSKRSEASKDNPPSPKQPPTDYKTPSSPDNTLRKRNIDQTSLNKKSSDDLKKSTETPSTRDNENIHTKEFDKNNFCKIMPDKLSGTLRPSTPPANNFDQISSESSSNDLEKSTEISSTKACQDDVDKFNENNFSKNMLDKLNNDTKTFSENFKSVRNISEEESIACGSNSSPKDAKKLSNQTASDVEDYKNEVYNTLLNEIHATIEENEKKEDMPNELVIDPSGESKEQQPAESNICEACEENHIKTRAYPCNHSYLCVDCAVRIFRIYKKCRVCLQPVEEFVQFSS